jgi:hypothetical protein
MVVDGDRKVIVGFTLAGPTSRNSCTRRREADTTAGAGDRADDPRDR